MNEATKALIFFCSGVFFQYIVDNFATRPKMRTDEIVVGILAVLFSLGCGIACAKMDHPKTK